MTGVFKQQPVRLQNQCESTRYLPVKKTMRSKRIKLQKKFVSGKHCYTHFSCTSGLHVI